MSKKVRVKYLGRKDPLKVNFSWLSEKFEFSSKHGNMVDMYQDDFDKLVKANPKSFEVVDAHADKFDIMDRDKLIQYAQDEHSWTVNRQWKDDTIRDRLRSMERQKKLQQEFASQELQNEGDGS